MPQHRNIVDRLVELTKSVPRLNPQPIPTADICDSPLVCISVNSEWASHILGAIDVLRWRDAWVGTDSEIDTAIIQIEWICEMFSIPCVNQSDIIIRNQNVSIYQLSLEVIYEGDIHNVDPDAPDTDFDADSGDSGDDPARRDLALCHACRVIVDVFCAEVLRGYGDEAAAAAIMSGVLGFLGPAGVAVGLFIGAALLVISGLEKAAFQSEEARQNVACCLYEALLGQPNTKENLFAADDNCYLDESSYENDITTAMRTAGWDTNGNWLAFNRTLGDLMRFARADLLSACFCTECLAIDYFWSNDHDLTVGDWIPATLVDFPSHINTTGDPDVNSYTWSLVDSSGVNYIQGVGYTTPGARSNTGGVLPVDSVGCRLTQVTVTWSTPFVSGSKGWNLWVHTPAGWSFAGGWVGSVITTQTATSVNVDLTDVDKIAIFVNSPSPNYVGRVQVIFSA